MQQIDPVKVLTGLGQSDASNALSMRGTGALSDSEAQELALLLKQMSAYYPHQEYPQDTTDAYLFDFGRLAERFGLGAVKTALLELRLRSGQKFFPHPTEVLEELEMAQQKAKIEHRAAYIPDPNCICSEIKPKLPSGLMWMEDRDGDRVIGHCPCWKQWKGIPVQPEDRKTVEAGA